MKKSVIIGVLVVSCLCFLSGCGNEKVSGLSSGKVLECTYNMEEEGIDISVLTSFNYNGKVFTDGNAVFKANVPDKYIKVLRSVDLCGYVSKELDDGYTNCKASTKGNDVSLSYDIDIDRFDADEDDFSKDMTIKDAKKAIEDEEDARCVIK